VEDMNSVRRIVEMGLAKRAEEGIKIRQPLTSLVVYGYDLSDDLAMLVADEVNVKKIGFSKSEEMKVELDTKLTEELKIEGALRELVRTINSIRKKKGLTITDKVRVYWRSDGKVVKKVFESEKMIEELKGATISEEFTELDNNGEESKVNGETIKIEIEKI
jgi:isoleucyl-tRNA synthetase